MKGRIRTVSPSTRFRQGDRIGRIFASRVNVYFGQFSKKYRNTPNFWATVSSEKIWINFGENTGLGYILGRFLQIADLVTLVGGKGWRRWDVTQQKVGEERTEMKRAKMK
jgi:hypothetical protein